MSISFSGLASGLDTSSWVKSLTALKQAKVTSLEEEKKEVLLNKDTLNNIKMFFSSFRSLLEKVTDSRFSIPTMDLFAKNVALTSHANVLTATSTSEAQEGTYKIKVDKLADNTKAVSNYKYRTTIAEVTTATSNTILKNIGVNSGDILVNVDGIDRIISIDKNETIRDFANKLNNIGVDAYFNDKTGVFSINITADRITDKDNTGIVQSLHLSGTNSGFLSNEMISQRIENIQVNANENTKLSQLGVKAGTIDITANDSNYQLIIEENDTVKDLIDALKSEGIDASIKDGVFTIKNANITNDGTTNLINAFGLTSPAVSNQTQVSGNLNFIAGADIGGYANSGSKINDLVSIKNKVKDGDTVIIKKEGGNNQTITLSSTSTLGDIITGFNNAGFSASISSNGSINIAGGDIIGGSWDIVSNLNLTKTDKSGGDVVITGTNNLQVQGTPRAIDRSTTFAELGISGSNAYVEILSDQGDCVSSYDVTGKTVGQFIDDMESLMSITVELNDGVFSFSGDSFIGGAFADAIGVTNIISTVTVSTTFMSPSPVTYTAKVNVTEDITLDEAGFYGGEIQVVHQGSTTIVTVNSSDTFGTLLQKIRSTGLSATLKDGVISVSSTNGSYLASGFVTNQLGIGTEILGNTITAGTSWTSSSPITYDVTGNATGNTELGLLTTFNGLEKVTVMDSRTGYVTELEFDEHETINDFITTLESSGIHGQITNGTISFTADNGRYITGAIIARMGLGAVSTTTTETVYTPKTLSSSSAITFQQSSVATRETKLADLGVAVNNATYFRFVYGHENEEELYTLSNTATVGDFLDAISAWGTATIDSNGVIKFTSSDGSAIGGRIASNLGMTIQETTVTVGATLASTAAVTYTSEVPINNDTKIKDLTSMYIDSLMPVSVTNASLDSLGNVVYNSSADEAAGVRATVLISSTEEFMRLNGKGYENVEFVLGSNIDLTGATWNGIELSNSMFNGNNHVITMSDVTLEDSAGSADTVGLFSYTFDSEIKNLTLFGMNVIANDAMSVGMLVGTAEGTIVTNIHVGGELSAMGKTGSALSVGGVVGAANGISISRVEWAGYVGGDFHSNSTKNSVGGIIGYAIGYTTLEDSIAKGVVSSSGSLSNNISQGGLIGNLDGSGVLNSNVSMVDVDTACGKYIGGCIGYVKTSSQVDPNNVLSLRASGMLVGNSDMGGIDELTDVAAWDTGMFDSTIWTLGSNIPTLKSSDDLIYMYRYDGQMIGVMNINSNTTLGQIEEYVNLTSNGEIDMGIIDTGEINITSGYIYNSVLEEALGFITNVSQDGSQVTLGDQSSTNLTINGTVTLNSNTTASDIGSADGGICIYICFNGSNGDSGLILWRATETFDEFKAKIMPYADLTIGTDGKISIALKAGCKISHMSSDFKSYLKFKDGESYTTTTVAYTNADSRELRETITVTLTADNTDVQLHNFWTDYDTEIVFKNSQGEKFTETITDMNTVQDLLDIFESYGYSTSINNNKITLTPTGGYWVESDSGDFLSTLGIDISNPFTVSTKQIKTQNSSAHFNETVTKTVNSSTTFGELGLNYNAYQTIKSNGATHGTYISSSTSVGKFISWLNGLGFTASVADGKISVAGDDNVYFQDINPTLKSILNWNPSSTYSVKEPGTVNTDSKVLQHNALKTISQSTTFSELGLTSDEVLDVLHDGNISSITVRTTDTVQSFFNQLSAYGLLGSISSGCVIIEGAGNNLVNPYIPSTAQQSKVLACLGINKDTRYSTTEEKISHNSDSNRLTVPTTNSADMNSKLSELIGSTSLTDTAIIINGKSYDNGASTTLNDLKNAFAADGMTLSIDSNGKLSLESNHSISISGGMGNFLFGTNPITSGSPIVAASYSGSENKVYKNISDDTLLSDLGITTGDYNIISNGVKHTVSIASGDKISDLKNTLSSFGLTGELVKDGDNIKFVISGNGSISAKSGGSNISNVLSSGSTTSYLYNYSSELKIPETITHNIIATEDTLLSEFGNCTGKFSLLSGENSISITIDSNDTFGTLVGKLRDAGVDAAFDSYGQLSIFNDYGELSYDASNSTSSLFNVLGLINNSGLHNASASKQEVQQVVDKILDLNLSAANYADYSTELSLLNISAGSFSVYRNGEKATIMIDKNDTFADLRSRISSKFSDVDLVFEEGYLKLKSNTDGVEISAGSSIDTSNFLAIAGLTASNGEVSSARELYKVNGSSVLTNSGLFRKGDITEGTFIIGDAQFEIDDKTTLNSLISQINSSTQANATAYWDPIEGKLALKSKTTGYSLINVEAGTSNFTDIMGFTTNDGGVHKLNTENQELGSNAKFSINGTNFTSTSNTITSDISRISGVTIDLKSVYDGEVTLTIEKDKEGVADAMDELVQGYNDLITNVDKELSQTGKLHDQTTLRLIRNQLRTLMTGSSGGNSVFRNLDSMGIGLDKAKANDISTDNINLLSFDREKFLEAFDKDKDALKDALVGTEEKLGILGRVENLVESSLKAVTGYFDSQANSYNTQVQKLTNKIGKQNTAVERYKTRLEAKFKAMDMLIANMQNNYSSFLSF